MFFRLKKSKQNQYLQIVENSRHGTQVKQRVLCTLGRLDDLQQSGKIESLLASGARFAEYALLLTAHKSGHAPAVSTKRIGPTLIFERLWKETGCQKVITELLKSRAFEFDVERAIFLTVLHRLLGSGGFGQRSDRACMAWKQDYFIPGLDGPNNEKPIELHHLYRAMAWLGETLPDSQQKVSSKLVPRCVKDLIEEGLHERRSDLFSEIDMVFFDTTSLYFEGEGGLTLGEHGYSKDHRPDLHQLVVGAVLDGEGRPICCEIWPGNTSDVTTLISIVDRLRMRFRIRHACVVADRGMISAEVRKELEETGRPFILGARMRSQKEVRDTVLSDTSPFEEVAGPRERSTDPAPLKVKEVWVDNRRYVVCVNDEQAEHDRWQREQIVASLREQLKAGAKSFVGNKGYKRYLKVEKGNPFTIDEQKLTDEARFDGVWVLHTNTELSAAEVACQYKKLWMVEQWFRNCKSLLETRPIFHHGDETIRGHVFCSFLALVLKQELESRLEVKLQQKAKKAPKAPTDNSKKKSKKNGKEEPRLEWADMIRDLERVQYVEVNQEGKKFLLRSELQGTAGKIFQAVGVAVPPTVQLGGMPT